MVAYILLFCLEHYSPRKADRWHKARDSEDARIHSSIGWGYQEIPQTIYPEQGQYSEVSNKIIPWFERIVCPVFYINSLVQPGYKCMF